MRNRLHTDWTRLLTEYLQDDKSPEVAVEDLHRVLLGGTAVAVLMSSPAQAGSRQAGGQAGIVAPATGMDDLGISVSVDGEQIVGHEPVPENTSPSAVSLQKADVQVKFDGFDVKPALNISTIGMRRVFAAGEDVRFLATANYPSWIARGEVRIYDAAEGGRKAGKPVAIIPAEPNSGAVWVMPETGSSDFEYIYRVYDNDGRFDETQSLAVQRVNEKMATHAVTPLGEANAPGYGEDRTAIRNIPVFGGAVTVHGQDIPQGFAVRALGELIPVDANGSFVVQRIVPPGDHSVDVAVRNSRGKGLSFNRAVNIPSSDWFYVGLADITAGKRFGKGKLVAANPEEFGSVYAKGRLAFYLKGKIKGEYLLTAAADTAEGELRTMFSGLDGKSPREMLRRIDPQKFYPVYGDSSTAVEDAPTSGKFYVRLEKGQSHVMWGNFQASVNGMEYLRNDRMLYGAGAKIVSDETTSFGEAQGEVSAYAALPGTLPQRDVFEGTGGSAYFLKRQDISVGSESVSVELRDKVTGRVLGRSVLKYGTDYSINYLQGLITLTKPLSSMAGATNDVVRDGAFGGARANLIVQYEYTPLARDVDGYATGARAERWLNDRLRVGVTGMSGKADDGTGKHTLGGADLRLRHSDGTYLDAEIAQSDGPGFGNTYSTDGGLTITQHGTGGANGRSAMGWRVKGQGDLADIGAGALRGTVEVHAENRKDGFSTLDYDTATDTQSAGASIDIQPTDETRVKLAYDDARADGEYKRHEAVAEGHAKVSDDVDVALGVRYSDVSELRLSRAEDGQRLDLGPKLTYKANEKREHYVFAQGTAYKSGSRSRNDRVGTGATLKLTEKVSAEGEVSYGTGGFGGLAALNYTPTADDSYHIGYKIDPLRERDGQALRGTDLGGVTAGARKKINEKVAAFTEDNYDMFGQHRSLTSTYGVEYTPSSKWAARGGYEHGQVKDPDNSDFTRNAVSATVSYNDEDRATARLRGELRLESSDDRTRDRESFLIGINAGYQAHEDWRVLSNIEAVLSQSNEDSLRDGSYVEASLGVAYRPVENNKVNALFKYLMLYDLPGADQVDVSGSTLGPRQHSNVLSADANYQVNGRLTLGAKYGLRYGEVETTRGSGDYEKNIAHLGILRADVSVTHNWDVLMEGRVLASPTAETIQLGALASVYRNIDQHAKLGLGYNFGQFSDDLTDLTLDDHGMQVNLVAKF